MKEEAISDLLTTTLPRSFSSLHVQIRVISLKHCFLSLFRVGMNFFQQATGIESAVYYTPKILQQAGIQSTTGLNSHKHSSIQTLKHSHTHAHAPSLSHTLYLSVIRHSHGLCCHGRNQSRVHISTNGVDGEIRQKALPLSQYVGDDGLSCAVGCCFLSRCGGSAIVCDFNIVREQVFSLRYLELKSQLILPITHILPSMSANRMRLGNRPN